MSRQRVGVDIGGTFTDLVLYDEDTGEISTTKAPTTPDAPEEGVLQAFDQAGVVTENLTYFMHGTTLVTNLILTRGGAKVGLITTKGFRDVLEIGRSYRDDLYDLQWDKTKPFVPRYLAFEVTERMDHKGNVLAAIDREEVAEVLQRLLAHDIEAIAVSLFNCYANPTHEQVIKEVIAEVAPNLPISLASEVDPRIREYQRVSTTVLNAYAMPRTEGYIERLGRAVNTEVKYMHSGGGIIPSEVARRFPITLVASGPTAGVLAGKFIGAKVGLGEIITADVGGTSFDVAVIRNGEPDVKDEVEVAWAVPARVQSVDVNSIGAGGGSIAWIDEGGALRVGPQSAGAAPGPACYDRGGTEPTVTDANLVLGILSTGNFLGGRLKLSEQNARNAIQPIADRFSISVEEAALGIYRIVNASMAQLISEATVKKGIDPRDFTLVPFGGAGCQHAVEVAREAGIPSILVPPHPSTFSAFGLLTADLKNTASQTVMLPLESRAIRGLRSVFKGLEMEARQFLKGEERNITGSQVEYILDIRYVGQNNEVAVTVDGAAAPSKGAIYEEFERVHKVLNGTQLGDPAEIVNARVTATGSVSPLDLPARTGGRTTKKPVAGSHRKVSVYNDEIPVYYRGDLVYGMTIREPCIIEEDDSTLFILEGCTATIDQLGNIRVQVKQQRRAGRR